MMAPNHSPYAESMRRLRSTLLLSRSGVAPKVLLVASARPGEGKSTLAVNLAVAFAQTSKRVLLVETDMRRPVLKSRFGLPPGNGLSQLLSDGELVSRETAMPGVENLFLVAGGPAPPYPDALLGSARFGEVLDKWRSEYDIVVLDSPPLLPVADALLIARYADATLLMARAGVTTRTSLQRVYKMLVPHLNTATVGVVLNAVPTRSSAYYEYYGYRQASYYRRHLEN
jgi:succinoglycan biosynthesis transport protein ExoP